MNLDQKITFLRALQGIIRGRWIIIFGTGFLGIVQAAIGASSVQLGYTNILTLLGTASFLNFAYWVYARRGLKCSEGGLKLVALISILVDQLFYSVVIYSSGGVESLSFVFYVLPILMATVLYGAVGILLLAGSSVLMYLGIIVLEFYQVIPHRFRYNFDPGLFQNPSVTVSNALLVIASVFLAAIFATFISRLLQEREYDLITERDKTRSIIANLTDGLVVVNQDGQIQIVNPAAEEMLGVRAHEWLRRFIHQKNAPENLVKIADILFASKDSPQPVTKEVMAVSNRTYVLQVTGAYVIDFNGERMGRMAVMHDITREKEIDRMKSEFISVASHQLRTPLSAIKWVINLLLEGDAGPLSKEQSNLLKKGYDTNERMITLVNDLLNVSRIEEGRYQYEFHFDHIEHVIDTLLSEVKPVADQKKIEILFNKDSASLPKVKVDVNKIRLAIQNLVDNAIKYTPQGGKVRINASLKEKYIQIEVGDSGVGIPKDQQAKIFQKFFRASNVVKMQTEGSGLGLFIVKNVVERHGGKIWFASEEGKGTIFSFTLPVDASLLPSDTSEFEQFMVGF